MTTSGTVTVLLAFAFAAELKPGFVPSTFNGLPPTNVATTRSSKYFDPPQNGETFTAWRCAPITPYGRFGDNDRGELGIGSTIPKLVPTLVPGLSEVTQISACGQHVLAVTSPGAALWAWGHHMFGEVGDGTTTQANAPKWISLSGVNRISAGEDSRARPPVPRSPAAPPTSVSACYHRGSPASKPTPCE